MLGDGGAATYSETFRNGYGAGVTAKYAGLTVGAYGSERDNVTPVAAGANGVRDAFEGVWYAKYSFGPVSVGYSKSYLDSGLASAATTAITTAKTVRTATGIFEAESMSIAFNMNENLSLSYTSTEDTYDDQDNAATAIEDVTQDTTALQVAYSMGAMSVKAYQMETKAPGYDSDAADLNVTEIALGLAF